MRGAPEVQKTLEKAPARSPPLAVAAAGAVVAASPGRQTAAGGLGARPDGPLSCGGAASPGWLVESEWLVGICGEVQRRG
jgi:hypothetical protein